MSPEGDYSNFSPAMQAALRFASGGGERPGQALSLLQDSGLMGQTGGFGAGGTTQGLGGFGIDPNAPWVDTQQSRALTKYGYDIDSQTRRYVAELNLRTQTQATEIEGAYKTRLAEMDARLQQDLLTRKITSEQYMQQRDLAQHEAEFARDLAFKQLAESHRYELELRGQRFSELLAQSELMASPSDIVAYELFKRGAGQPTIFDQGQGSIGPGTAGGATPGSQGQRTSQAGVQGQGGNSPELLQSPYSDQSYQQLASSLYGAGNKPAYSPQLAGPGIFGVNILAPNQFSRSDAAGLSDAEFQQLGSFLKAGIDMGGGRRVGINPADYFQQAQNSWVPTLAQAGTPTRYA